MRTAPIVRTAKGMKTRLWPAVPLVGKQQKGFVEKHLLRLGLTDIVFVHALAGVTRIPLKSLATRQIDHKLYMT